MMDTIKGTMTEIYNDLSKSTSGNTIAEVKPVIQKVAYSFVLIIRVIIKSMRTVFEC